MQTNNNEGSRGRKRRRQEDDDEEEKGDGRSSETVPSVAAVASATRPRGELPRSPLESDSLLFANLQQSNITSLRLRNQALNLNARQPQQAPNEYPSLPPDLVVRAHLIQNSLNAQRNLARQASLLGQLDSMASASRRTLPRSLLGITDLVRNNPFLSGVRSSFNPLLAHNVLQPAPRPADILRQQLPSGRLTSASLSAALHNNTRMSSSALSSSALSIPIRQPQQATMASSSTAMTPRAAVSSTQRGTASLSHESNTSSSLLSGRPPVILYVPCDEESLTPYQCLARKQIELFEAQQSDVEAGTQKRSIVLGQVGIRCRHCGKLSLRERARGSTYFPSKLNGLYQAGQNMANSHLIRYCHVIPQEIRDELVLLGNRKSGAGGGRDYWSGGARILGVTEDEHGLRFEASL